MDQFVAGIMGKVIEWKRHNGLINGDSILMLQFLHKQRSICFFLIEQLPSLAKMNQEYLKFSKSSHDTSLINVMLKSELLALVTSAQKIRSSFIKIIEERYKSSLLHKFSAIFRFPSWIEPTLAALNETLTQLQNIFAVNPASSLFFKTDASTLMTFAKKTLSRCNEELTALFNSLSSPATEKALQAQLLKSMTELYQESCIIHEKATMLHSLYPIQPDSLVKSGSLTRV